MPAGALLRIDLFSISGAVLPVIGPLRFQIRVVALALHGPSSYSAAFWRAGVRPALSEELFPTDHAFLHDWAIAAMVRKGAPWLKPVLVQAAWGAARKKNSYFQAQFLRLKTRHGAKTVSPLEIRRAEDIAPAFDRLGDGAEFLFVCADPLLASNRVRINILAAGAHLPTISSAREYVEAGGLISYGPNIPDLFRRAGDYVDKILRGAKPGDLPVEQPTKFDLVINLIAAKAVGLSVPSMLLARADEVIE